MDKQTFLSRLAPDVAEEATGAVLARVINELGITIPIMAKGKPVSPAAADLLSMTGPDTGADDLVSALDPVSAWYDSEKLPNITTHAVDILSRSYPKPEHRSFCRIAMVEDFKLTTLGFQFFGAELQEISDELAPNPIFTSHHLKTHEEETGRVRNYGASIGISRRNMINDRKLGFLAGMTEAITASAYRMEAGLVYGALENNPNLADGNPWFDASNSVSAATVSGALSAGLDKLLKQTLPDGQMIGLTASFIVIPSDWSVTTADMIADVFMGPGKITVIRSGYVTCGYLFSSPSEFPSLALLCLHPDAQPEIRMESRNKNTEAPSAIQFLLKISHPIGVIPLSRRGVVKIDVTP